MSERKNKTDRSNNRLPYRRKNTSWVFHLLNVLSCHNTAAVSSSHGNLMQECKESVAIDLNLNSVMLK